MASHMALWENDSKAFSSGESIIPQVTALFLNNSIMKDELLSDGYFLIKLSSLFHRV